MKDRCCEKHSVIQELGLNRDVLREGTASLSRSPAQWDVNLSPWGSLGVLAYLLYFVVETVSLSATYLILCERMVATDCCALTVSAWALSLQEGDCVTCWTQ